MFKPVTLHGSEKKLFPFFHLPLLKGLLLPKFYYISKINLFQLFPIPIFHLLHQRSSITNEHCRISVLMTLRLNIVTAFAPIPHSNMVLPETPLQYIWILWKTSLTKTFFLKDLNIVSRNPSTGKDSVDGYGENVQNERRRMMVPIQKEWQL